MRVSIADLLPLLALAGAFAPATAQAKEAVVAIREAVAGQLGLAPGDVDVGELGLVPGTITDLDWRVELPRYAVVGESVDLTLSATGEAGPVRLRVSPTIYSWQEIPVAATDTLPRTPVTLSLRRLRSDTLRGEKPVDPAGSWEATTTLRAGQPVTTTRVRQTPDRREGDEVGVVVKTGGVEIRTTGTLQSDAYVGQPVPVVLSATKFVKSGRWSADGYVILGGS